jgi:hypothetical protein
LKGTPAGPKGGLRWLLPGYPLLADVDRYYRLHARVMSASG